MCQIYALMQNNFCTGMNSINVPTVWQQSLNAGHYGLGCNLFLDKQTVIKLSATVTEQLLTPAMLAMLC